jgi:cell division cycle 14
MDGEADIIPGVLHLHFSTNPATPASHIPDGSLYYWVDNDLIYEPFCADFGPCNLAQTWKFCQRMLHLVERAEEESKMAYVVVGPHPHKRANAAVLMGIYLVLYLDMTPSKAYDMIAHLEPFCGFRDASCGVPSYTLGVAEILKGMAKAKKVGFINWHKGEVFDYEEYEYYEQVENGDMNWIVPGKFLAFAGPYGESKNFGGWRTFTPEDYVGYFHRNNIQSVVRLNKKLYDGSRFSKHKINHHDLYFPDGTCPSDNILKKFLDISENTPGALAVHCKAGLGRTGVLICCYMMKHYDFTAEEAMGYIRVCRPGSVIGPQQHYLLYQEAIMRQQGQLARSRAMDGFAKQSVINIVATSRTIDMMGLHHHQQTASATGRDATGKPPQYMIHADARNSGSIQTPEKDATFAPMPSLMSSPAQQQGETSFSNQCTPQVAAEKNIPPSSTKRVLAPNGQPRKIPLAMDFDSAALEDLDGADMQKAKVSHASHSRKTSEDWSVGSRPVLDSNTQSSTTGVGVFAAAAGRGATAFVEAFRSVVSAHRASYKERYTSP